MMKSSNPTLNANVFTKAQSVGAGGAMTLQGTVNKTIALLACVLVTATFVWNKFFAGMSTMAGGFGEVGLAPNPMSIVGPLMMTGAIGGFIVALVTIFNKQWSPVTAPIYALLEGLFLGGISAVFEAQYPGIVIQAVALTFGTLFSLLMAYKSGMIKATENFKLGVVAATGAICLIYIVSFIMSFFGGSIPLIHSSGTFGILFSLFVVTIAALNLVMDFDFIEHGAESGAPKYMEWYGAFGLMVTLIWLYIEFLRLLAKLQSRR